MTTAFVTASDAIVAALSAAPALAGGRIKRGRQVAVGTRDASAIHVNTIQSDGQYIDLARSAIEWTTVVQVSIFSRAIAAEDAEQSVDTLLAATWARLAAMTRPAGMECVTVDPRIQWDADEADQTLGVARIHVRMHHLTQGAALTA